MRPLPPRLVPLALLVLAALVAGCREKPVGGWIADLDAADPYRRQLAACALGSVELARADPPAAVRALAEARDDPSPLVAEQAAASYRALRPLLPDALTAIVCADADAEWAARELAGMRTEAVAPLARALADPACADRALAARALGAIGAPALDALLEALRDGDAATAALALDALEDVGPPARAVAADLAAWAAARPQADPLRARAERLAAALEER